MINVLVCIAFVAAALGSGGHATAAGQGGAPAELFEETGLMFIGEDLYTTTIASRKAEPLQRAPAAVTVIQGRELKRCRTLSEVLRRVPGFFVDRTELKERIYLRGIPDSFLVMMDGVPFSSDASTIDYPRGMDLSLEYIDKIEIIRGPGSALWGPDAFSGIVNLVTKKGASLQGTALQAETGSYDTRRVSAQVGSATNGWDTYLFGSYGGSEGFESDLSRSSRHRKDDIFRELYGRLSYRDVLEVSGRYSRYRDYYSVPGYRLQGSEFKSFSFLQATLNKSFESSSLSLQGWFQYFDSLDDYDQTRYSQFNRQWGLEFKYDRTLFGNNFATIGASLRYNDGSTTRFSLHEQDVAREFFPNYDTRLYSAYFQDKWKLCENLEVTVGLRYDNHSEYRHFFSPRVGLSYVFAEHFSLKLLYGRAFRTPSLAVLVEKTGLDPEQIDSYEVALGFHWGTTFLLEANYFYNEFDNIIEREPLGEIRNSGDEHIKGVEVSMRWRLTSWLSLYANYSHLFGDRQKGVSTTRLVPSQEDPSQTVESTLESFYNVSPDNTFNCGIEVSPLRWVRLSLDVHYIDERRLQPFDSGTGSRRTRLSSETVLDACIEVLDVPWKNMELALQARNITDEDCDTRGVYGLVDGEGRSLYLLLRYRF